MILLDTNAVIWLERSHARVRTLARRGGRFYVSPATLLELQMLDEIGKIRLPRGLAGLRQQQRWLLDDPPAVEWFTEASAVGWTRDPFDRLIVAHARLRGWTLAIGDSALAARLPSHERIVL